MSSLEARYQERNAPIPPVDPSDSPEPQAATWPDAMRASAGARAGAGHAASARELRLRELVEVTVVAFRHHPHIGNVMTHISRGHWDRIGEALHVILDPQAARAELTPLAENILDLLCAERGVTGRTVKPYFRDLLDRILPPRLAARLSAHVACLFLELEGRRYRIARERSRALPPEGASQ